MTSKDFRTFRPAVQRLAFLVLIVTVAFAGVVGAGEKAGSLLLLIPSESQFPGWKTDGAPETAEGQDLFLLINGGAEMYLEAGFARAVLATYKGGGGKTINLEVFEMASPESAGKIHEKKTGNKGKKLPIGDDAVLEDYYLNFRSGRFQVTISGHDSEEGTRMVLMKMARIVAERIRSSP